MKAVSNLPSFGRALEKLTCTRMKAVDEISSGNGPFSRGLNTGYLHGAIRACHKKPLLFD
jgi:hypothetical protein